MSGWVTFAREVGAMQRRHERQEHRRHKELLQRRAHDAAAHAVEVLDAHLALITSVHKDCGPRWDWERVKTHPAPVEPTRRDDLESYAQTQLQTFAPGFFGRLFGGAERRRAELAEEVALARAQDDATHRRALDEFNATLTAWQAMHDMASAILARDIRGFMSAINETHPFEDIRAVGTDISLQISEPWLMEVELTARGSKAIPDKIVTLTKTGKGSVKDMPKTRHNELLQDYVCGCVLRAAREIFALLPVDVVVATARDDEIDPATGNRSERVGLAVIMPRATVESLNFEVLDPSEAIANFIHRSGFKRGKGFQAIEPLTAADVPQELRPRLHG